MTLTANPAILRVAVRFWPVVLPCTVTVSGSVGVPVPLDGVMVAQVAVDAAVHVQVDSLEVSVTGRLPPLLVNANEVGLTAKLQGFVVLVPFCDTLKLMPAMVNIPVRTAVPVFAAACRDTVRVPLPL